MTAVATKATIGIIGQIREDLNLTGSIGVADFAGIFLVALVVRASRSSCRSRPATATMVTSLSGFLYHRSIQIYMFIIHITKYQVEF